MELTITLTNVDESAFEFYANRLKQISFTHGGFVIDTNAKAPWVIDAAELGEAEPEIAFDLFFEILSSYGTYQKILADKLAGRYKPDEQ